MPHAWNNGDKDGTRRLVIWRHRSLTPRGFAWFIAATAAAMTLPLLVVIGSPVMWGLLPFAGMVLASLWIAMQHGWTHGGTVEEVELSPGRMTVIRHDPGRPDRSWEGNPYWVRLSLREGPVEDYLTLSDGRREIELGAFVTPEERRSIRDELLEALASLRR